jgi:hypothetical protein
MASHIGRRKFLVTLGGAAAAWPLAAQQPGDASDRVLHSAIPGSYAPMTAPFRKSLNDAGYFEGQNVPTIGDAGVHRVSTLVTNVPRGRL